MMTRALKLRGVCLVATTIGLAACATQTTETTQTTEDISTSTSTTVASTTSAPARSDFPESGPIEPGTYHIPSSAWAVAGFTLTMPEGWETQNGSPGAFKPGEDGEVGFYFVTVDTIYADPCVGSAGTTGGELLEVGSGVDDLANALLDQPHTVAIGPVDTTLGGRPAKRIELTMASDPETATCNIDLPGNLQIWFSEPADAYFVLPGDGSASVYILDVNGERQVVLAQHPTGAPGDELSEMQTIIESITIDT